MLELRILQQEVHPLVSVEGEGRAQGFHDHFHYHQAFNVGLVSARP